MRFFGVFVLGFLVGFFLVVGGFFSVLFHFFFKENEKRITVFHVEDPKQNPVLF